MDSFPCRFIGWLAIVPGIAMPISNAVFIHWPPLWWSMALLPIGIFLRWLGSDLKGLSDKRKQEVKLNAQRCRSLVRGWLSKLADLAVSKWLTRSLPILVSAYLAIFGLGNAQQWPVVVDNIEPLTNFAVGLIVMNAAVLFLGSFAGTKDTNQQAKSAKVLTDFLDTLLPVVNEKIVRIRSALKAHKDGEAHKLLVAFAKGDDQIRTIGAYVAGFFRQSFSIKPEQLNITIKWRPPTEGSKWEYCYKLQQWAITPAEEVMREGFAGFECLKSMEPIFFPSKMEANEKGLYTFSNRDTKKNKVGSVYVHPVLVETAKGDFHFVISIVTYGKQLCDQYESVSKQATERFLKEICTRLELELCLKTIDARS